MRYILLWAGVLMLVLQPAMAQKPDKAGNEEEKKGGSVEEQIKNLSEKGKDAD